MGKLQKMSFGKIKPLLYIWKFFAKNRILQADQIRGVDYEFDGLNRHLLMEIWKFWKFSVFLI